ncbi:MAG TPA: alpha/beta hydrolase [Myxococcales bacterium]|jgi:pimeloyl-ACP methyl ester carboxylesterase|nr:alpha/beta hydrolase [Myxococcales bacterium]
MSGYFRQDFLEVPDGVRLYFQVHGEGQPGMVLCDGLGCDGFVWKYLLPQLAARFRTLRWHYRGHGRSTVPEDRERVGMLYTCDDLDRVMAHVGMEKAVIFGHSMGVQVALEFQRRYPGRCAGLALLCGSYGNVLDTFHDDTVLKRAFPLLRMLIERFPHPAAAFTRLLFSTELAVRLGLETEMDKRRIHREDVVPYFDHLAKMDPVVFVRSLDSLAEHSAWEHLPHIDVPSLVLGGERDSFTPVWLSRRMADAIPGSELVIVPAGTHTLPLEQPALVWETVQGFLDRRVLPALAA